MVALRKKFIVESGKGVDATITEANENLRITFEDTHKESFITVEGDRVDLVEFLAAIINALNEIR